FLRVLRRQLPVPSGKRPVRLWCENLPRFQELRPRACRDKPGKQQAEGIAPVHPSTYSWTKRSASVTDRFHLAPEARATKPTQGPRSAQLQPSSRVSQRRG